MNTTQRDALYLAEYLEKFRSFPEDIAAAAELRNLHARIGQLEKSESDLITERDCRDEVIDRMADAVLGAVRTEWSSSYDLYDAVQEVEDVLVQVEANRVKVAKLKAEVKWLQQQLIAEAKKTAEEKLRADKLDKQHSMQAAMHKQANEEIVLLKSAPTMSDEQIKSVFLANGFTIKSGHDDLKPYVYQAARALLAATQPAAQGMDARDAAFEAVRKAFCKLQRYSFFLDGAGNVRRCADHCGNWVEFDAAHTLFEPQSVDAAIAAQAKQQGKA